MTEKTGYSHFEGTAGGLQNSSPRDVFTTLLGGGRKKEIRKFAGSGEEDKTNLLALASLGNAGS